LAVRIAERGTVFNASEGPTQTRFCTTPGIACSENGTLVASFRAGAAKESAEEDVYVVASDDAGTTWRRQFSGFGDYIVGGRRGRIRSVALTQTKPNRLMGSFIWFDRSDPSLQITNPETTGVLDSKLFVAESGDAGRSWSRLREVPVHPHKGVSATGSPILVLSDGTLALPYEAWKEYYDRGPGVHYAALRLSHDAGETWEGPVVSDNDPRRGQIFYWDQHLSVNPDDGRILAMFWTHDRQLQEDLPIHIAWGSHDAKEWTPPISTGIVGQITAPMALPGGKVVAVYNHRHDPPSIRAILSDDFGHSWDIDNELILYQKTWGGAEAGMHGGRTWHSYWEDFKRWTFGMPTVALLPDGDLVVLYYAGDLEEMSIYWARIAV
jgi:hypothetical protein